MQDNVCSKVFGARWPHSVYVSFLFLVLFCALATSFLAGRLQHWMVISGSHILLSEYIIQFVLVAVECQVSMLSCSTRLCCSVIGF